MRGEDEAGREVAQGYARAAARDRRQRMWRRVAMTPRGLAIVAGLIGTFVIVQEIPFWGSRSSSLWQVLTALGVGLVVLAVGLYQNAQK